MRRALSAGRVHEDYVLQAVASDHHGRAVENLPRGDDATNDSIEITVRGAERREPGTGNGYRTDDNPRTEYYTYLIISDCRRARP